MKHLFRLVFALLIFVRIAAAQPASRTTALTGDEILAQSAKAYLQLSEYRGKCVVISQTTISVHNAPAQSELQTAQASFDFKRGQFFKIEGRDTGSEPFSIDHRGEKTTLTYASQGKPKIEKSKSLELAVAAMTGVAASAPTTIPALLTSGFWGFPYMIRTSATLKGHETLAGHDCFVVTQPFAELNSLTTFWIDSQSLLLRQMREEGGEQKISEPDSKEFPAMRDYKVWNSSQIHVFSIDAAVTAPR